MGDVMNPETLEALKASIAKWEQNAVAETPDRYATGPHACPLCVMFLLKHDTCGGCPVALATGISHCNATPYVRADRALSLWALGVGSSDDAHEAARKEVAFLRSLLPDEATHA